MPIISATDYLSLSGSEGSTLLLNFIAFTYLSSSLESIWISLIGTSGSKSREASITFLVPKIGDYLPSLMVIRIDHTEPPTWYSIFLSLLFYKFSSVISLKSL